MDLNRSASAGQTIGFSVNQASDVTFAAGAASGSFPVSGNIMTVAVVSDLGRLSLNATAT